MPRPFYCARCDFTCETKGCEADHVECLPDVPAGPPWQEKHVCVPPKRKSYDVTLHVALVRRGRVDTGRVEEDVEELLSAVHLAACEVLKAKGYEFNEDEGAFKVTDVECLGDTGPEA